MEGRFHTLVKNGTAALQNGDIERAVRLLERAHRMAKENADVVLNLGGAYILSKKFAEAVAILEPLSEREPHNPMVWTNLGAAYLGNPVLARPEDQERAIAAFEQAFELNPATPNVAYNLGLVHRDRQERKQALFWFRRAVQVDPRDRDALRNVERLTGELEGDDNGNPESG